MAGEAKILVLEDAELFATAARMFIDAASRAIAERGEFCVALSGGSTPQRLYRLLASEYLKRIRWRSVHVFFGDERCVPPEAEDSNFRMVRDSLLTGVALPKGNVHRMKGELDPAAAAEDYADDLQSHFGEKVPEFDLILLGMGDDGHTASIFPGTAAVHESEQMVVAHYVEKVQQNRLTLTPPVLTAARSVVFLVTGEKKAPALKEVLEGDYRPEEYPAQLLRDAGDRVVWLVDPAAASLLQRK